MIQHSVIESVKSQIIQVIGDRIPLTKRGGSWIGLCPFHPDQKPSFSVSEQKNIWRCWSEGIGGDVISFIQKFHGVDFNGALKILGISGSGQKSISSQSEAVSKYDDIRRRREAALTEWRKEFDELCLLSRCYKRMMANTPPLEHEAWWYMEELIVEQRLDEMEDKRREIVARYSGGSDER